MRICVRFRFSPFRRVSFTLSQDALQWKGALMLCVRLLLTFHLLRKLEYVMSLPVIAEL